MSVEKAQLTDGQTIKFKRVSDPPAGGMKMTFFTPDRAQVVQFFHDPKTAADPQRAARLAAILGKYNPTLTKDQGGAAPSRVSADYFKRLFCWPTGVVASPTLGIVSPAYPGSFYFATGPFAGKEKEGRWFLLPKVRKMLPDSERGPWINYFKMGILMARAVRRLHMAGLAHSDLSPKNILVDPLGGSCVVIDIDSLVVPGLYPPDVLGTPGYIAPEVLATNRLALSDPARALPGDTTDQHALAVLLYEYLLLRHPLRGPKHHAANSEDDEWLLMGKQALFVEHPTDRSNRPADLQIACDALGPLLKGLFDRTFVEGLHNPANRPAAIEWERALVKTWDMLVPCANPKCSHGWFVLHDPNRPHCSFCRRKLAMPMPILRFRSERRTGQWLADGQLSLYHNNSLFLWHAYDNFFPGEEADRTPQAYCAFHEGRWLLINQSLTSLTSPGGNRVVPGKAVELTEGAQIRLSQDPHGRIAEVQMVRP